MREAGAVGRLLEPLGLLDRVLGADRRSNMDGLRDVGVAGFGYVLLGKVIPLGELLYLITEGRVWDTGLPVAVVQLWMLHVVQVDVGVYEVYFGHVQVSSAA